MKKLLALFAIVATLSLYSCDEKKGEGDAEGGDSTQTEMSEDTAKPAEAAPADTAKPAATDSTKAETK